MTHASPQNLPKDLTDGQLTWLREAPVFPEKLTVRSVSGDSSQIYTVLDRDDDGCIHSIGARCGHKGFVLRVQDPHTTIIYAAKLAVPGDYTNRRPEEEVARSTRLRAAGRLFICADYVGYCEPPQGMPEATGDFVCFIAQWVDGIPLENWLLKHPITPEFACAAALDVLRAIIYLERVGLKHDDLHSGNIMISRQAPELALIPGDENKLQVSVIDFGSLKPIDEGTKKARDDWISFVQILVDLFNGLHSNRQVASSYPGFMRRFEEYIDKVVEEDCARYFPTKSHLAQELRQLSLNLEVAATSNPRFQPFEAISAEHLADDATLLNLFVENLPWMQDVQENKPLVLTGPRGCGKSMIFRYLAARTHFGVRAPDANKSTKALLTSFGVYISCATHLQNNLSWIARKEGRASERAHEISTYFQLVVVRELLRSLGLAFADAEANALLRLNEQGFDQFIEYMGKYFTHPVESPRLTAQNRLMHFADDFDSIRVALHSSLLADRAWGQNLPDTFLGDVTQRLGVIFPYFRDHQVVFLLDDYSSNRVQPEIQAILNKIVFERVPSHYFKISCEKFGFVSRDIDGASIDESREFSVIDAGAMVLSVIDDAGSIAFVENLVNRRLAAANWSGTARKLIGPSDPHARDENLATYIRNIGSTRGRHNYYYGLETLGRLWSGDTATTLQIVREMFVQGGVNSGTTEMISHAKQHDAIVSISRAFKERVDGYYPYGSLMSSVLGQFGAAARDVLVKGRLTKNGKPYRLYRVEMTKDDPAPTISLLASLDKELADFARELLRRAIFIELQDSRAKEGPSKQTMRWELRRIFNPAFGLSLRRDGYLGIKDLEELRNFLTKADIFGDRVRASYAANKTADRLTGQLFGVNDE